MNIDIAHTQYASAKSDKQKICLIKNECFDCDQKKHHHKNCSTNSYNKIQQTAIINLSLNASTRKFYVMSVTSLKTLKENAAAIIDFFYQNDVLTNLNVLIKLLEMIYNDVSQKYMILIRFKTCQQMNCEFISFYSEFLALMNELN